VLFCFFGMKNKGSFMVPAYKFVILSERSVSKDLRTDFLLYSNDGAKIPRLILLARDDRCLREVQQ